MLDLVCFYRSETKQKHQTSPYTPPNIPHSSTEVTEVNNRAEKNIKYGNDKIENSAQRCRRNNSRDRGGSYPYYPIPKRSNLSKIKSAFKTAL
ncbi:hypothetical protein TNIN_364731 [Trichonephila inaurata madagascariensis]|uniref:Uncharacterized protein n=1 Tax=Trichonephila inaurata madagascariensis TaxID=2747483 RepID=A0A8X6YCU2_9ARAC|nr:hypothetical protein TNIN_364731 [Trichonephila inaurata madagascariensis]